MTVIKKHVMVAALRYAIEQATNSGIEILEWADNPQGMTLDEQIEDMKAELMILEAIEDGLYNLVDAAPIDMLPKLLNLWQALYRDPMAPNAWGDATYELIYDDYMSADMQPNEDAAKRVADAAEALANEFSHELLVRLEVQERIRQAYSTKN